MLKGGYNKGQKRYGPNRSRSYEEEVEEYTEELYKNDVNDPDNDDGMITCLKPDIME